VNSRKLNHAGDANLETTSTVLIQKENTLKKRRKSDRRQEERRDTQGATWGAYDRRSGAERRVMQRRASDN